MVKLRQENALESNAMLEDHFFIQRQYEVSETIVDLKTRIMRQNWIQDESIKLLKKRSLIIKQMLCESTKKNYGINNEEELLDLIRKQIHKNLLKVVHGDKFSNRKRLGKNAPLEERIKNFELAVNRKLMKKLEDPRYFQTKTVSNIKNQMYLKYLLQQVIDNQKQKYAQNKLSLRSQRNLFIGYCFRLQSHQFFNTFITLCIIANTFVLAQDRYPIEQDTLNTLDSFNTFFYFIFFLEMIVKLVGVGYQEYFRDKFNTFDCSVVVISTFDVIVVEAVGSQGGGGAISAMRAFRLLRVFKLAKAWQKFKDLLLTIGNTMVDIGNFSILLLLLIFTYTLLGLELFSFQVAFNEMHEKDLENGKAPQANFNTFLKATTSVFIVLANEGWTDLFINHYRATNKIISSLYFLSLIIIGQYIMLNLFLSILLKNFDESTLNQEIKKTEKKIEGTKNQNIFEKGLDMILCRKKKKAVILPDKLPLGARKKKTMYGLENRSGSPEDMIEDEKQAREQKMLKVTGDSHFKQLFYKITTDSVFENFILFLIVISSVQLALENPLNDPESYMNGLLFKVDLSLTIIFTMEAIMKIIAFGFVMNGENSYIRNPANIIDFIVVIVSIASLMTDGNQNLSVLKVFRLLRILRPLRMVAKNEGLKLSIVSLFESMPQILNVILVSFLFFLIFGIIGVNYLKGQYYFCDYSFYDEKSYKMALDQLKTRWDCYNVGGIWKNNNLNFDNIFEAVVSLFTLANRVGWVDLMFRAVGSAGIDKEPIENNRPQFMLFFFVFIIVASFFVLNLFVGIVISTYNREKEKQGKDFLLTNKQKKWLKSRILIIQSLPKVDNQEPSNIIRKLFFKLAVSKLLDYFIYLCIVLNIVVLTIDWYGMDRSILVITEQINLVFAIIFTVEAAIKLIAFDKKYFKDKWNVFDFVIVCGTNISLFLQIYFQYKVGGPQTTVIRAFRIGRIMRLFKRNKSLQIIFETFIITTPHLANIGSLMMLFLYMYSVLGVQMFSYTKIQEPLNKIVNFQSIGIAFLTLFRVTTGESWHLLMHQLSKTDSLDYDCKTVQDYSDYKKNGFVTNECGDTFAVTLFFFSFVLLINLIFINLFTAIVLQGYSEIHMNDSRQFNAETTQHFQTIWAKFDREGTSFIHVKQFDHFMEQLGPPLGWSPAFRRNEEAKARWHKYVDLKKYSGQYYQYKNIMEKLAMLHIIRNEVKDYAEMQEIDLIVDKAPHKKMMKRGERMPQSKLIQLRKQNTIEFNKKLADFNRRQMASQYAQRIDSPKIVQKSQVLSLEDALRRNQNSQESKFKLALMKKLGLKSDSKKFYKELQKMALDHESDASRASVRKSQIMMKPNSKSSKNIKSKFLIPQKSQSKEIYQPNSQEQFDPDMVLDSQKEFDEPRGLESQQSGAGLDEMENRLQNKTKRQKELSNWFQNLSNSNFIAKTELPKKEEVKQLIPTKQVQKEVRKSTETLEQVMKARHQEFRKSQKANQDFLDAQLELQQIQEKEKKNFQKKQEEEKQRQSMSIMSQQFKAPKSSMPQYGFQSQQQSRNVIQSQEIDRTKMRKSLGQQIVSSNNQSREDSQNNSRALIDQARRKSQMSNLFNMKNFK